MNATMFKVTQHWPNWDKHNQVIIDINKITFEICLTRTFGADQSKPSLLLSFGLSFLQRLFEKTGLTWTNLSKLLKENGPVQKG